MKRSDQIRWIVVVFLVFVLNGSPLSAKYSGGTGELYDPYQVGTADDLILLGNTPSDYDKHFILTADIDLDPNLLGGKALDRSVIPFTFSGSFSGNGFSIWNLTIVGRGYNHLGLFHTVGDEASISNLRLEKANIIQAGSYVGLLAGYNSGWITECSVTGAIHSDQSSIYVGGLVGFNEGSIISCCSFDGEITVPHGRQIGGLVGANGSALGIEYGGNITDCYSTFKVNASSEFGLLIGYNNGPVERCYTAGELVTPSDGIWNTTSPCGSLVGEYYSRISIRNCFILRGTWWPCHNNLATYLDESDGKRQSSFDGWDFYGNYEDGFWDTWFMPEDPLPDDPPLLFPWQTEFSGLRKIPYFDPYNDPKQELQRWLETMEEQGFLVEVIEEYSGVSEGQVIRIYPHRYVSVGQSVQVFISKGRYNWSEVPGDGTEASPFEISTVDQLQALEYFYFEPNGSDRHFILVNDLDLGDRIFEKPLVTEFAGILNGNNYTVSNLLIHYSFSNSANLGLIGKLTGSVRNLSLENTVVIGGSTCGGLAGINEGTIEACSVNGVINGSSYVGGLVGLNGVPSWSVGTIINCRSSCSVTGDNNVNDSAIGGLVGYASRDSQITDSNASGPIESGYYLGGLVGRIEEASLIDCHATGLVQEGFYVGGLVGDAAGGTITGCSAAGSVSKDDADRDDGVGGLVGRNTATITYCYAKGDVRGGEYVGGLVGWNYTDISNSYATGDVSSGHYVGGLVGYNSFNWSLVGGTIINCCAAGRVSQALRSDGLGGLLGFTVGNVPSCYWLLPEDTDAQLNRFGTGLTETEMKQQANFADWDFVGETENGTDDIWWIDEGQGYPRLWWELPVEEAVGSDGY